MIKDSEKLFSLASKETLVFKEWPLVKGNLRLKLAITAALFSGHMLQEGFNKEEFETHVQKDGSEYTPFDEHAENISSWIIKRYNPSAVIMGEEISPNENVDGKNFWVIDGIDGTTNFARRIPICNHTLAYIENGETKVGVVCDFLNNNVYYAVKGKGAYLNSKPISVSDRTFAESVIAFAPLLDTRKGKGQTEGLEVEALWRGMREISEISRRFHREFQSGGLELAWVASGKLDGYASSWTNPWDLSAGALLVSEAGGIATDIFGESWKPGYYGVIAGNKNVHAEMISILKNTRLNLGK